MKEDKSPCCDARIDAVYETAPGYCAHILSCESCGARGIGETYEQALSALEKNVGKSTKSAQKRVDK